MPKCDFYDYTNIKNTIVIILDLLFMSFFTIIYIKMDLLFMSFFYDYLYQNGINDGFFFIV